MPGANYKVGVVPDWFQKADSIADLATALKIDPTGLAQTIQTFNANALNGVDPDWHRGKSDFDQVTAGDKSRTDLKNPALAPLVTPPFYGANIWPGTCGTNGGLQTNVNAQVLKHLGKSDPRVVRHGQHHGECHGRGLSRRRCYGRFGDDVCICGSPIHHQPKVLISGEALDTYGCNGHRFAVGWCGDIHLNVPASCHGI